MLVLLLGCAPYDGPLLNVEPLSVEWSIAELEPNDVGYLVLDIPYRLENLSPDDVSTETLNVWEAPHPMERSSIVDDVAVYGESGSYDVPAGAGLDLVAKAVISWVYRPPNPGVYEEGVSHAACVDSCMESDPESVVALITVTLTE